MDRASWAVHQAKDSRIAPFHRPVTIVLKRVSPQNIQHNKQSEKWEFIAFIRSQSASRNTQLFCDTFAFLVHNHTSMPRDLQGMKSLLLFKMGLVTVPASQPYCAQPTINVHYCNVDGPTQTNHRPTLSAEPLELYDVLTISSAIADFFFPFLIRFCWSFCY